MWSNEIGHKCERGKDIKKKEGRRKEREAWCEERERKEEEKKRRKGRRRREEEREKEEEEGKLRGAGPAAPPKITFLDGFQASSGCFLCVFQLLLV